MSDKPREERVIELEEKIAHLEHLVQELNGVVTAQDRQIAGLKERMERLVTHVRRITPDDVRRPEEETPPPHY